MKTAAEIIQELEPLYKEDPQIFEFKASMFISGPQHKQTRREILYTLTGTKPPASKAGLQACVIQLKIKYDQTTLF